MSKKRQKRNTKTGRKALKRKALANKTAPVGGAISTPVPADKPRDFTIPGDKVGRVFTTDLKYSHHELELCSSCAYGIFYVDDYLCRRLPHYRDEWGEIVGSCGYSFHEVYEASGGGDDSKRVLHCSLKQCAGFEDSYTPSVKYAHLRADQLGRVFEIIPIDMQTEETPCDSCGNAYQEGDYLFCSKLKNDTEGHENWGALEDTTWHTNRERDGLKFVSCESHEPV